MPQAWKYARVTFNPLAAEIVAAKLTGWAAMGAAGPARGPGLTQDEAVQFVTELAILRHSAACGLRRQQYAVYDASSGMLDTVLWSQPLVSIDGKHIIPIVGDESPPPVGLRGDYSPSLDPTKTWPRDLVLAIDNLLRQLKRAELGGSVPAGYGLEPPPGGPGGEVVTAAWPLPIVAVVVGGAAIAVIGTAALWRYLDPEVRNRAAVIRAAAKSYEQRLQVLATTGTMPPASSIETSNAAAVVEMAKTQAGLYWGYGAAAIVGIGGGAAFVSWLRKDRAA